MIIRPSIHAVETGLSADPPMLARVSSLRRFTVLSNSDAHSAQNLGREANELDCPLTYDGIARAIRDGAIVRTIEFFPEEGKYHHDGHRQCGVSLSPPAARKLAGACPVCGKPLTLGVLHRVEDLADVNAESPRPFSYQMPLRQVLAQVLRCGESSKKVGRRYSRADRTPGTRILHPAEHSRPGASPPPMKSWRRPSRPCARTACAACRDTTECTAKSSWIRKRR